MFNNRNNYFMFLYRYLLKKCLVILMVSGTLIARGQDSLVAATNAPPLSSVFLTGKVYDAASKKPVNGASVSVPGLYSSITDSTGYFRLRVPNFNTSVKIATEGYQTVIIPLKGRNSINVYVHEEPFTSFYDEVQLPFDKQPLTNTTHAIGMVQTGNNWTRPTESPDNLLQGKIAGLNVVRRSGTPLQGANLFLRGYTSLNATNQPLIVIDGILYDNNQMGPSSFSTFFANPLSYVDPKDIDNITVLKDASSTYGSKGANGAILITTSRARELATRIDLAIYGGYNFAPAELPVMDAGQYRTYLSDLLKSRGMTDAQIAAQPYMNDNISNPNYYRYHNNTNWQKNVAGNSMTQNVLLKITGGDNIATYGLSLGYLKDAGVIKETGLSKYNMRFNANLNLSKKLSATANLSYAFVDQNLRETGLATEINPLYLSLIKSPFVASNEISDDGQVSPNYADVDIFGFSNPSVAINGVKATNRNYRFTGSFGLDYEFNKNWNLGTIFGVNFGKVAENMFVPRKGISNDTLTNAIAESRMYSRANRLYTFYNDSRLTFTKDFNTANHLVARLGFRYLGTTTESDFGLGYNSATDELISVGTGVNALRQVGGESGQSKWMSVYANAEYAMRKKFFLSFNISGDGSSKFGKEIPYGVGINGNRFGVYPSVGAAWLISSENFMSSVNAIDLFKLRISYGLTGNDDIGNYTARKYYVSQNLLGLQGTVRANIGNPQLGWERNSKLNAGLDIEIFNERVRFSIDAYSNKTKGMMIFEDVISAAGGNYIATNSGNMVTRGFDAQLDARIINTGAFKWDLGFNIGAYRTKMTALPQTVYNHYAGADIITQVGGPITEFFGYKTNGVYVTNAEAAATGLGKKMGDGSVAYFSGGDVKFVDVNGDKLIDYKDRQVLGSAHPDVFGGISTRLTYKRFSLEGLLTFVQGNEIYNHTRMALESQSGYQNQTQSIINRWRADGQVTDVPKTVWGDPMGNSSFSDRWIEDGSYMRLRNASLVYKIPIKGNFIRNASVYVTGNNLFTLTNYKGYDPEFSVNQAVYSQGIDVTLEPQFRSVLVGVRVGL